MENLNSSAHFRGARVNFKSIFNRKARVAFKVELRSALTISTRRMFYVFGSKCPESSEKVADASDAAV